MALSLEMNILFLGFLVLLSGFFSSVELAVFSISKLRLRRLVGSKKRNAALLEELKRDSQKLLTTILIGNNLVNVAAASIATALAIQIFPGGSGIAIATFAITLAILIFGEITPKSLALKHNEKIALAAAPAIKFLAIAFAPLLWFLEKITSLIMNFFGGPVDEETLTEEEVKTVVSLGAEEGAIRKDEKEMIHRIFKLNDLTVEDIMTPRSEMEGIVSGTKLKDIPEASLKEHSRFPVYSESLDDILGIFHYKDFLGTKLQNKSSLKVDQFMKPAMFVYGTKKIDKLLKEFQKKKTHLAVVVDEYGGTVGLVTIEDILEEIVGEIEDETDIQAAVKKVSNNEFVIDGQVSLERLNELLGTAFKSEESETIAGLIIETIDRVPKEGEKILLGKISFFVNKMDGPKILELKVKK